MHCPCFVFGRVCPGQVAGLGKACQSTTNAYFFQGLVVSPSAMAGGAFRCLPAVAVAMAVALLLPRSASAWKSFRIQDNRQWCQQVEAPLWPYAYTKLPTSTLEIKVGWLRHRVTRVAGWWYLLEGTRVKPGDCRHDWCCVVGEGGAGSGSSALVDCATVATCCVVRLLSPCAPGRAFERPSTCSITFSLPLHTAWPRVPGDASAMGRRLLL